MILFRLEKRAWGHSCGFVSIATATTFTLPWRGPGNDTNRGESLKFCYVDESGHGAENTVVVGVTVDSIRMHRTKADWNELIYDLNDLIRSTNDSSSREIPEMKGRELYRGNANWRRLDGGQRTRIIEIIIRWMCKRKHKVTFGAVSKSRLSDNRAFFDLEGFQDASEWCIAAMHLVLGLQKQHQKEKKNKGHTLFVFDNAQEEKELLGYVLDIPKALSEFYSQRDGSTQLDQVIDVPYFADSKHVGLIQVADLFAYIIRLYADLTDGQSEEKFDGELERLREWLGLMRPVLFPSSTRWAKSNKEQCVSFLRTVAPPSLLAL